MAEPRRTPTPTPGSEPPEPTPPDDYGGAVTVPTGGQVTLPAALDPYAQSLLLDAQRRLVAAETASLLAQANRDSINQRIRHQEEIQPYEVLQAYENLNLASARLRQLGIEITGMAQSQRLADNAEARAQLLSVANLAYQGAQTALAGAQTGLVGAQRAGRELENIGAQLDIEDRVRVGQLRDQIISLQYRKSAMRSGLAIPVQREVVQGAEDYPTGTGTLRQTVMEVPQWTPQDDALLASLSAEYKMLGGTGATAFGGGGVTLTDQDIALLPPELRFKLTAAELLRSEAAQTDVQVRLARMQTETQIRLSNLRAEMDARVANGQLTAQAAFETYRQQAEGIRARARVMVDLAQTAASDLASRRGLAANLAETERGFRQFLEARRVDPTREFLPGREPGTPFGGPQGTRTNAVFIDPTQVARNALAAAGVATGEEEAATAATAATAAAQAAVTMEEAPKPVVPVVKPAQLPVPVPVT